MVEEIRNNLYFLTENITALSEILVYLVQHEIITKNESDEIKAKKTSFAKNGKLLSLIQKKDWPKIRGTFLEILRKTTNDHCAKKIEEKKANLNVNSLKSRDNSKNSDLHPKIGKWWPDKKELIKSLHKRKLGSRFLVEELHHRIFDERNKKRIVVICESADASKYSGMGGVGKTLTAKWYAHHYEEYYDHILWIDCGEGRLEESFKKLARKLKVEDWDKLENEDSARESFEVLVKFKCLWIFDNAESYRGKEGIIKALPKNQEKFSCLITSRSREWGVENVGFGKISDLPLDIFSEQESLEFLKAYLKKEINYEEFQLKELISLLGNLPLALQLAIAALNNGKLNVKSYIEKNKFEKVVNLKFEDYEKTISGNVNISLDLILQEENGQQAHEILIIFGYIRPDDIQFDIFKVALNLEDKSIIKGAIKLLKKYSLVGKSKMEVSKETKIVLSIHRLLQQVIRHNGRKMEEATLRKILGCDGFIEYKLIPFTKYADEELRKEFPKVKTELLDQAQLKKLIKEEKLEEAVLLAKFIHEELKTNTTLFNYAICQDKSGQTKESLETLHKLEKQEMREESEYEYADLEMGILRVEEEVARDLIVGHLLVMYWKINNKERVQQILEEKNQFGIIPSDESLDILIQIVTSHLKNRKYSLILRKDYDSPLIRLDLNATTTKIDLRHCSLSLPSSDDKFKLSPEELKLKKVSFTQDGLELEQVKVNDFIDFGNIKQLQLNCDEKKKNMRFDFRGFVSMDNLWLQNVNVLNWRQANWNVQKLELWGIPFVEESKLTAKEMEIRYTSLDVSWLPRNIQQLRLDQVKVLASGDIDLPQLKHLSLWAVASASFSLFRLVQLTHVDLYIDEVNVDELPTTVTELRISDHGTRFFGGRRRLDNLILDHFSLEKVEECLSRLHTDNLVVIGDYGYGYGNRISSEEFLYQWS